jgi:hypothetical protein
MRYPLELPNAVEAIKVCHPVPKVALIPARLGAVYGVTCPGGGRPAAIARNHRVGLVMDINTDRIDDAVLALLYLTLHDKYRAWKGFDWNAMNRLHEKGFISDPVGKAKSVVFTEEGLRESKRLFRELFGAPDQRTGKTGG